MDKATKEPSYTERAEQFDTDFKAMCIKYQMPVAYVAAHNVSETSAALATGGSLELCKFLTGCIVAYLDAESAPEPREQAQSKH